MQAHSDRSKTKYFGIGLPRTGTTSLTHALTILGYRAIHFPAWMAQRQNGVLHFNTKRVARFDVFADLPVVYFMEEIAQLYPDAHFILTMREIDPWLDSMSRIDYPHQLLRCIPSINEQTHSILGTHDFTNREILREAYEKHQERVDRLVTRIGQERLLCIDLTKEEDCWSRLCRFVGKAVPDSPFPHKNKGYVLSLRNITDFLKSAVSI